ncbi:11249_t:CDS:2 [Ambispora gerdemannii]|uniref:11249_t:CDS:1 n=1 Tax=Ambispora gerdemannii TaxID=144530 RepID=A0A9N8WHI4_9GLOM|nr:11249_t:CDS:2 [Ambispora gerdemannii]
MSSSSPSQNSASSSPSHNSASYVRSVVGLTIISAKLIPGLEVAATIAQSIDEQARKLKNNRETCKALVEQVRISQTTLEKYKPNYDDFQDAYKQYIDILKKIEDYIKQLRKPGNFSRQFINKITRYIHAKEDEELLKQFMDTLTQATNAFNLEVSVQMYNEISKMSTQMHKLEISHIVKGLDARPSDIEKTRIKPDLIANDPSKEKVVRGKALVKKMYRSQPVAVRRTVDEYSRIEKELKTKLDKEAVIRKLLSDCNNIEKFHGTVVDSNYLSIVTEWAENGNLCDYLQKEPNIRWIDKWRIASEIGNAVNKNVLLDEHLTAKLSNFGTSRLIDQSTTTIPGLRDGLEWKAPEKIRSEVERRKHDEEQKKTNNIKYDFNKKTGKRRKISDEEKKEINNIKHEPLPFNKQMDVYSFAITLWELAANGKSPFSEITSSELEDAIIAGARPLIPDNTPPKFEVFIKEAWDNKGDRRPKIDVIATNLVKNYQLLKENYQTKNCLTIPPSTPQRSLTPELSLSETENKPLNLSSRTCHLKEHTNWSCHEFLDIHRDFIVNSSPSSNEWNDFDGIWFKRFLKEANGLNQTDLQLLGEDFERSNKDLQAYWEGIIKECSRNAPLINAQGKDI